MAVYCARAGLLPFQPGADRQSRKALERGAAEDLMHDGKPTAADLTPQRSDLDPIEIASRDEIAALQLERLKWSLKHAYDNVAHYKRRVRQGRRASRRSQAACRSRASFPFTTKDDLRENYPFGMFAVPREQVDAHPRLVRHDRQADGGRLHRARHRHVGGRLRAQHARERRAARHDGAHRLRLRPVHRRARRALRRRAAGLHGGAGVGRHDRAAGAADRRFQARRHHGDAELHACDSR